MASRNYYTGSMVSSTAIEEMIANMVESGTSQDEFDSIVSNYREYMTGKLEELDDRLWWQPETGEIFCEDDGSEKPLPDTDSFEAWWNDATSGWTV